MPLSGSTLGLILVGLLAGLFGGLLTLAGAALIGETPAVVEGPAPSCTAFWVGSPHAARTRIHLENVGPERDSVRFDFADGTGIAPRIAVSGRGMAPWAFDDLEFRTPALGVFVELTSPGRNLRATVVVLRDDGAPPQGRDAAPCRDTSAPLHPR